MKIMPPARIPKIIRATTAPRDGPVVGSFEFRLGADFDEGVGFETFALVRVGCRRGWFEGPSVAEGTLELEERFWLRENGR